MSPLDAAIQGTRMAVPITFGVLTTVMAFLPMAFDSSDWGSMFRPIAIVFIIVMLIALMETKLILPSHLATPFLGRAGDMLAPIHRFRDGLAVVHRPGLPALDPFLRESLLHHARGHVRRPRRPSRVYFGGRIQTDLFPPRGQRAHRMPPHHARWHAL
jgi:hypothetical protein